jgi:cytochrome P450
MSASNDSTANYLNMLFYYLSTHPEVQTKLRKAIKYQISKPEDITFYKVRDIEYLEWCLLETTRMYGPGSSILLREITQDAYLDNIPIVKGTGFKI